MGGNSLISNRKNLSWLSCHWTCSRYTKHPEILRLKTYPQGIDGSAGKPALEQDTDYMVKKSYNWEPYLDPFGAYLFPNILHGRSRFIWQLLLSFTRLTARHGCLHKLTFSACFLEPGAPGPCCVYKLCCVRCQESHNNMPQQYLIKCWYTRNLPGNITVTLLARLFPLWPVC